MSNVRELSCNWYSFLRYTEGRREPISQSSWITLLKLIWEASNIYRKNLLCKALLQLQEVQKKWYSFKIAYRTCIVRAIPVSVEDMFKFCILTMSHPTGTEIACFVRGLDRVSWNDLQLRVFLLSHLSIVEKSDWYRRIRSGESLVRNNIK